MNRYFLCGTCAAALAFALPAVGQSADTDNTSDDGQEAASVQDTITVTGYRASWTRALQNKRNADDIRDVITSTEVGELPDQNVAEAIQRVPGVSITRDQGEGQFVTIRGLPPEFSRTTINGMTATSSDNGRAVQLDLFASDLFSTIEIVKSPSAEDTEGGLSGQINLVTHDPAAVNKPLFSADVAGFYNDLSGELGPKLSLIGANEFLDGKLSALAAIAYSDRSVRQDVLASGGWNGVGDLIGGDLTEEVANAQMWENGQLRMFEEDRERLGLLGAVSFSPSSGQTYEVSALYSKYDLLQTKYQFLNQFKSGSSIQDVRLEGDTVVAATFPEATIGSNNQRRTEERDSLILTGSGEWALDRWLVKAGLGLSETNVETPEDLKYVWEGTADIGYDLSDPYAPDFSYPNTSVDEIYSNPALYTKLKQIVVEDRNVEDAEARVYSDIERDLDIAGLSAIKGGFEYRSREKQQSAAKFQDRSKPKTNDGVSPLSDYVGYHEGDGYLSDDYPFWSDIVADFGAAKAGLVPAGGYDIQQDLLNSFDVSEDTLAGYAQLDFDTGFGSGNAGLRVLRSELDSSGYASLNGGAPEPATFSDEFTEILPSVNWRLPITDKLYVRAAAARVIARAAFEDMAPRRSVDEVEFNIRQGNPELDPYKADQLDISLEYYADDDTFLALAGFYKDVDSFIFDQTSQITLDNPERFGVDPALAGETFNLTRPENGQGAEVKGVELVGQYAFTNLPQPLSGFGVNANVTWTDSEARFTANEAGEDAGDETNLSQDFPLPGLSEWTANLQVYYELAGFSARLAYNWRDDYLITPAGAEADPEFAKSYDQLDGQVAYEFAEGFKVYAEVLNITNEPYQAYTVKEPRLLEHSETGRRVFFGLRYTY